MKFDVNKIKIRTKNEPSLEKKLTGEVATELKPVGKGIHPNAELEGGEYLQYPDGLIQRTEGRKHKKSGVKMNIPQGTKILSNKLKLTANNVKEIKDQFDIKLSTKATYSDAQKKYEKKIGVDKINETQEKHIETLKKELEKKDVDEGTFRINQQHLSKQIYDSEKSKKEKQSQRSIFFNFLFNLQEGMKEEKGKINPSKNFKYGGIMTYENGGPTGPNFLYEHRPDSKYRKDGDGNWYISNPSTKGKFVKIKDPDGRRAKELSKNAKVAKTYLREDNKSTFSPIEQSYLDDLKFLENGIKKGYENGIWKPHKSVEGGLDTIAYGHKLKKGESFKKGLTEEEANKLLIKDYKEHKKRAKDRIDSQFGKGAFDKLDPKKQVVLTDYEYNVGLRKFPKFAKAVIEDDKDTMLKEYKRYSDKDEMKQRNGWTLGMIEEFNYGGTMKFPIGKIKPLGEFFEGGAFGEDDGEGTLFTGAKADISDEDWARYKEAYKNLGTGIEIPEDAYISQSKWEEFQKTGVADTFEAPADMVTQDPPVRGRTTSPTRKAPTPTPVDPAPEGWDYYVHPHTGERLDPKVYGYAESTTGPVRLAQTMDLYTLKNKMEEYESDKFEKNYPWEEGTTYSFEDGGQFGGLSESQFNKVCEKFGVSREEGMKMLSNRLNKYEHGGGHDLPPYHPAFEVNKSRFTGLERVHQSPSDKAFGEITKENLPEVMEYMYRNFPDIVSDPEVFGVKFEDGKIDWDQSLDFSQVSDRVERFQSLANKRMVDSANTIVNNPELFGDDAVNSAKEYLANETFLDEEGSVRAYDSKLGNFTSGRFIPGLDLVNPDELEALRNNNIHTVKQLQEALKNNPRLVSGETKVRMEKVIDAMGEDADFSIAEYVPQKQEEEKKKVEPESEEIVDDVNVEKKKTSRFTAIPDMAPLPPSGLQAMYAPQSRFTFADPIRIGIEKEIQTTNDALRAMGDQILDLPPQQRAIVLSQFQATRQNQLNEAAQKANIWNAQQLQSTELYNAGQRDRMYAADIQNKLGFERNQMTAQAKTEEDWRNFYDDAIKRAMHKYEVQSSLGMLQDIYPDVGLNRDLTATTFDPDGRFEIQKIGNFLNLFGNPFR